MEEKNDDVQGAAGTTGTEAGDARDAAKRMKEDAARTLQELKSDGGVFALFNFNKMYFPFFARTLFIVVCVLMALIGVLGIVAAFIAMAKVGFFEGLKALFGVGVMVIVTIIMARIWVELTLVAFKINEGIQDIRAMLKSKM